MADDSESPRLKTVAFRGVGTRLPPRTVLASTAIEPTPTTDDAAAAPPQPSPALPATDAGRPVASPQSTARSRAANSRTGSPPNPPGPRSRVGTGQLQVRIPIDLSEWIRGRNLTQRALLLLAFADHGDSVAPSNDPMITSRLRLGLPVRPLQKRRGPTELINFTLTGEEKDLIETRAAKLNLSLVEFVTQILRLAQQLEPGQSVY
jgi:hypothetical protein